MASTMAGAVATQRLPVFDNSSMWHNFTLWTGKHLGYAVNMSRLAPSLEDLVWAGPRMVMKLGKLGSFISFPDAIDGFGQRIIPESTEANYFHVTSAALAGTRVVESTAAALPSLAVDQESTAFASRFSMEGAKGLGSVFSYATSKWAFCCIAMAAILNRTVIFSATRRRLRLRWYLRLLLRAVPIIAFTIQSRHLLQSIQCQTSRDFGELRWGNSSKSSDLMFAQSNAFLHGLSSTLLLGPSDRESCLAVQMIPPDDTPESTSELRGSLSRLWPLFGTFCLSDFIETVSCAVQGRPVAAETGMTLFKHSLAFAEADAAISNQLGWSLFSNGSTATTQANLGSTIAVTRSMIMKRVNTSPEVLLVAYLSAMSHVTSHILGVLNLQSKFRLLTTGFWGLCFMASIIWSALTFSLEDASSQGLLRYPTVCIIGFIPHVLVLAGMLVCCFIYLLALLLCTFATPDGPRDVPRRSFLRRIADAHGNMQANVSLSDIRIRMDMDFYTALLRAGFAAITMASEAVYLNEDRKVNLKRHTWLEDERLRELDELRMQWVGAGVPGSRFDSVGTIGLVPVRSGQSAASSGYSREKVAQKVPKNGTGNRRIRDGVGAAESSGRWLLAVEYIMHINKLLIIATAVGLCRILAFVGIRSRPRWLRWLSQRPKVEGSAEQRRGGIFGNFSNWNGREGSSLIPRHEETDTEAEWRKLIARRLDAVGTESRDRQMNEKNSFDATLDATLYSWWLRGEWFGSTDTSGDYEPQGDPDSDLTSEISHDSFSDRDTDAEWESEPDDLDEGQRTPTQQHPHPLDHDADRADNPLDLAELARLLHPSSPEERDEARALAARLTSDRVMTRSAYARAQQRQRAQVLAAGRSGLDLRGPAAAAAASKMTPEEEMQLLEQILLSRRARPPADGASSEGSWATGAAGLGPDGPQCVVCQSAPRTIIVWPCRCLSLCDDCRVSLAMNNFDNCVCCRREVISFSRIFVP